MSVPTAPPIRPAAGAAAPADAAGAPYDWASRRLDPMLAAVTQTYPATLGDAGMPSRDQGDRLLALTAPPLSTGCQCDSGNRSTGTIARELADRRPRRIGATAQHTVPSITSEVRLLGSAGTATPDAALPAACQAALHSLLARYTAIASRLTQQPHASHPRMPAHAAVSDPLTPCHVADADLEEILFFRRFNRSEIAALRDGLRVVSAARGARIDTRTTLWIVLRGAVQTSLRHGTSTCRVRVAGPGRCVGHLSLIADRTPNPGPVLEAELRERAVLLEMPIKRANSILGDDAPGARRFAQAFNEDIAKALNDADESFAPPSARRAPLHRTSLITSIHERAACPRISRGRDADHYVEAV